MTKHYSINNVSNGLFAVYEHATKAIPYEGNTREDCQQWIDSHVLYLRKENYTQVLAGGHALGKCVAYYRDPEAKEHVGTNIFASRPTRRNKWVSVNGLRYRACWLPDLPENA